MPASNPKNLPDKTLRLIVLVWCGLIGLVILTVVAAYLPLGAGNMVVSLAIAVGKAALVGAFYMHLRSSSVYVRTAALVGVFTVSLLFMFTAVDYLSRITPLAPWQ